MTVQYKPIATAEAAEGWCVVSHVYVLLFHDVWDVPADTETVTVEGVFTTRAAADAAYADAELTGRDYFTVEQHEVSS